MEKSKRGMKIDEGKNVKDGYRKGKKRDVRQMEGKKGG